MGIRKNILKISKKWGEYPSILALLLMLLAPLSPVWAPLISQDGKTLQICTLQGLQDIVFATDTSGADDEGNKGNTSPCPFCNLRDAQDLHHAGNLHSFDPIDSLYSYVLYENIERRFSSQAFNKGRRTRAPPQYS